MKFFGLFQMKKLKHFPSLSLNVLVMYGERFLSFFKVKEKLNIAKKKRRKIFQR